MNGNMNNYRFVYTVGDDITRPMVFTCTADGEEEAYELFDNFVVLRFDDECEINSMRKVQ